MIHGVTHKRADIQRMLGTKAPNRGHVVTLGVPWEQGPFIFPYAALIKGQGLLALPAFPGPSPSAGVSAHETLEPVWPAAGPRGASRPQLPGPAGAGQPALGAAGCGPVPARPSGPGVRTQALRAAGIPGSGPVGCPTLSLGLYFLSWPHCFRLGCWPWPRTSNRPGAGIHIQPTGFESRPPAKGFAGLEPKPQAPGVGLKSV